jgi:hypothetical protein
MATPVSRQYGVHGQDGWQAALNGRARKQCHPIGTGTRSYERFHLDMPKPNMSPRIYMHQ